MPNRRVRLEGKYAVHHAIPAGSGGGAIVRDDTDRGWLMREIRKEVLERGWLLAAFCLMDTHVHLLIETPEPDLSVGIERIQGRYARAFNKRHDGMKRCSTSATGRAGSTRPAISPGLPSTSR